MAITPGEFTAMRTGPRGVWTVRAPRRRDKFNHRDFYAVVHSVGGEKEDQESNARLFAAAPKLLQACKDLVAAAGALDDTSDQMVHAASAAKLVIEETQRRE